MSYYKMSKAQIKNNEIVVAWLQGQPYQMNSRDKHPQIPTLAPWDVREKFTPSSPGQTGQFFSTRQIAGEFRDFVTHTLHIDVTGKTILEPSAGLASLVEWTRDKAASVTCFELDSQLADLGQKIEPWIAWQWNSPFDPKYTDELEGQFDLVFANPPFGTTWGMGDAQAYCQSGAKRAEHCFLELIIRALKPDGVAVAIAPPTFLSGMPKRMQAWLKDNATFGPSVDVQGQFDLTKVSTVIWSFGTKRAVGTSFERKPVPAPTRRELPPIPELMREIEEINLELAVVGAEISFLLGELYPDTNPQPEAESVAAAIDWSRSEQASMFREFFGEGQVMQERMEPFG